MNINQQKCFKRYTPMARHATNNVRGMQLTALLMPVLLLASCVRMGQPDGGWYDETPPKVINTSPEEGTTQVTSKKIHINFNGFIKLENATEKVVVSPLQLEAPEIKS